MGCQLYVHKVKQIYTFFSFVCFVYVEAYCCGHSNLEVTEVTVLLPFK
jgi:hypothetical protein